jgi:hypothetical protein
VSLASLLPLNASCMELADGGDEPMSRSTTTVVSGNGRPLAKGVGGRRRRRVRTGWGRCPWKRGANVAGNSNLGGGLSSHRIVVYRTGQVLPDVSLRQEGTRDAVAVAVVLAVASAEG